MLTVVGGITLTIGSDDGAKIVFDGNRFSQTGTLIKVNGNGALLITNADLRNSINTDHGGATFVNGGGAIAEFTHVTFKNNSVTGYDRNGGAIANFSGTITLTECIFIGNSTNTNGGALTLDGKATLIRCIIKDNSAGDKGGAMFIACNANDRTVYIEGGEISGNTAKISGSAIYLVRGIFTISGGDSAVKIYGEIFRGEVAIRIDKALPDFSGVTFNGFFNTEEKVLFMATGDVTFTDVDAKSLKAGLAVTSLSKDNKTIMVKLSTAKVTVSVNGTEVKQEVALGNYVLPETVEGLDEDKCITAWISNGISYSIGQTVVIDRDCTFIAETRTKFTVTLKYSGDKIHTYYIEPDAKFYLPADSESEQYSLMGWKAGNEFYIPSTGVTITGNTVFEADMVKLFKVTFYDKDEETIFWYGFSHSIILEECSAPEGKEFLHWNVNGETYKAGNTVRITCDTIIAAVFSEQSGNEDSSMSSSDVGSAGDNIPLHGNGDKLRTVVIIIVVLFLLIVGTVVVLFIIKRKKTGE